MKQQDHWIEKQKVNHSTDGQTHPRNQQVPRHVATCDSTLADFPPHVDAKRQRQVKPSRLHQGLSLAWLADEAGSPKRVARPHLQWTWDYGRYLFRSAPVCQHGSLFGITW